MEEYEKAKLDAQKKRLAVSILIFKHISFRLFNSRAVRFSFFREALGKWKTLGKYEAL